jgi:hypothetical protein
MKDTGQTKGDMNSGIKTASDFFKSLNCTNIMVRPLDEVFGQLKADYNGKQVFVRVQLKPEWGTDHTAQSGTNWNDARYPYRSIQFILPSATEGKDEYTHYILVSASANRCFLCPKSVLENCYPAWASVPNDPGKYVSAVTVENWTPKCAFFVKVRDNEWVKDRENIWTEPTAVPMDADAFLKSL